MMNDHEIVESPELEERLRGHFARRYGSAPSVDTIWERVAHELEVNDLQDDGSGWSDEIQSSIEAARAPDVRIPSGRAYARNNWARTGGALAAAVLLVALGASIFRAFAPNRASSPTATPGTPRIHLLLPGEVLANTQLNAVQMLSATDGWAVGGTGTIANGGNTSQTQTLILHYAGGRWRADPFVVPGAFLSWISMDSATDGWAGGNITEPILLHYTEGTWREVAMPDGLPVIALQMLSPSEGWAIEIRAVSSTTAFFYLLHYSGGAWSRVSQSNSHLTALALLSPTEGWAAGVDGVIARLHDGVWTQWSQMAPTNGRVTTLQTVSGGDGWLAGYGPLAFNSPPNSYSFMMHYDGTSWKSVALPALPPAPADPIEAGLCDCTTDQLYPSSIGQFSMNSTKDGWAVGALWDVASLILHYSGGTWKFVPFTINATLNSVSMVSADEGWAVGSKGAIVPPGYVAIVGSVLLHYSHGAWSVYKP